MSNSTNSKIKSNTSTSSECIQNDSVKIKRYSLNEKFTIISNESMEDPNISFAAKGLLSYILSRPTDWCVYVNQLASIYVGDKRGNGRDAIYSMINELKERGYVRFIRERNDKGQWNCWYEVYAVPQDFKIIFPQPVKSGVVKPNEVKPDIITSNECTKKLNNNVVVGGTPPPSVVENNFCKDDIHYAKSRLNKDWTEAEIEEAWKRFQASSSRKSDPIAYVEGIINKLRINNQLKEKNKCPTQKKIPQEKKTQQSQSISKDKESSLEKGTSGRILAEWYSQEMERLRYQNSLRNLRTS